MSISTDYDVIVVGGGMAGCAAAVGSARRGARTLLMERYGFLGGWATAALVNPFMSHTTATGEELIGGVFQELLSLLDAQDALYGWSFDCEMMKVMLQELVLASGAELLLHAQCESVCYTGGDIAIRTDAKSGGRELRCRRLVDCSGDGDAAVALGARYEMGDQDGLPQAVTLMFDMGGVDFVQVMAYVRDHADQFRFPKLDSGADPAELGRGYVSVAGYYDLIREARKKGEYDAAGDLIFFIRRARDGEVTFNTTHIGHVDGTNAEDLTRAEIEGTRQMMSIVGFVKKYVPGFESSYLLRVAPHVGVRETRRIIGEYVFDAPDVVEARKFDDAVCRLAYPVDIHSGKGHGYTEGEEKKETPRTPPPGDWYEIPYRCLVPVGPENVLVAGRCVSSTQAGHGAIRIMPSCAAMGEAAGLAAALSLESGVSPRSLDGALVRGELRKQGALL